MPDLEKSLWLFSDDLIGRMLGEVAKFDVSVDPELTHMAAQADEIRAALETEAAKRGAHWSIGPDGKFNWGI